MTTDTIMSNSTKAHNAKPLHPGLNHDDHHGHAQHNAEKSLYGFWVFMMSDLIIFGLFFATYVVMYHQGMAGGPGPMELFDLKSAFIQTMLLLLSSFTFGLATISMNHNPDGKGVVSWLIVTFLLGAGFLVLELHDFAEMFKDGGVPQRSGYLSSFFGLVPLHGLHVFSGMIWLLVMLVQIKTFGLRQLIKTRIMRLGLFWHFLDIIWIGIFSIVYLGGLAQ